MKKKGLMKKIAVLLLSLAAALSFAAESLLTAETVWTGSGSGRIKAAAGTVTVTRFGTTGKPAQAVAKTPASGDGFYLFSGKVKAVNGPATVKASLLARNEKNAWLFQWFAPGFQTPVAKDEVREFAIRCYPRTGASFEAGLTVEAGAAEFFDLELREADWKQDRAADAPKFEYWIGMDYGDEVDYRKNLGLTTYREKEIVEFFEKCKAANVTGVHWRVSALGQMTYPSKGAATTYPGRTPVGQLREPMRELAAILKEIDPLAIAVREARKHGIELYIWMTLADEAGKLPDGTVCAKPEFLYENPDCLLMDRQGNHLEGTLAYTEPKARAYRLGIVKELLEYGADGLYFCTRSHSSQFGRDSGDDYGFNPAVVAEYKKRYGVDILTQEFDLEKWRALKAEGFETFLKEAADLIHAKGQKLRFGVASMTLSNGSLFGNWGKTPFHWRDYLQKGWIDSILNGQYHVEPYFASREINRFREAAKPEQKFYFWAQMVIYGQRVYTYEELETQSKFFAFYGADGGVFHEALNMEEDINKYLFPLGEFYDSVNQK